MCPRTQRGGYDQFVVVKALKVFHDGQWEVYALGDVVAPDSITLQGLPAVISLENTSAAIQHLAELEICCSNENKEFLELWQAHKDAFVDKKAVRTNYIDKRVCFNTATTVKGTIRHVQCARLVRKAPQASKQDAHSVPSTEISCEYSKQERFSVIWLVNMNVCIQSTHVLSIITIMCMHVLHTKDIQCQNKRK